MAVEVPQDLIDSLQTASGFHPAEFRAIHTSGRQVVSVRSNPAKVKDASQVPFLHPRISGKVPWSSNGYYLNERPLFTVDPLFHAGAYYVQEASSMFLEEVLRQTCDLDQPAKVLDLCAAPGGKSTLIQSLINEESLLVSNEVIKTRANVLAENITKWGAANVVVTNNDPKDFKKLPSFFDCVVVDAPCSGSGMFRKDPAAVSEWSLDNVSLCSQRQQRILADVYDALKPGGVLVYSTCSYSVEEDEAIADWLKDQYDVTSLRLGINEQWNIVESVSEKHHCYGYRFYPDRVQGEGFFICVFRKEGNIVPASRNRQVDIKKSMPPRAAMSAVSPFVRNIASYHLLQWQDDVLAIPAASIDAVLQLQQHMYIRKAGINLGTLIRNELLPSHELVVSVAATDNIQAIDVDEATALDYLRRKDISLEHSSRGWAVLRYHGISLGLVKILNNRLNNYYPKDWRILNK